MEQLQRTKRAYHIKDRQAYCNARKRSGKASADAIAFRRAADPEYDRRIVEAYRQSAFRCHLAVAERRASDPEFENRFLEHRRLAALAMAKSISNRRALDPEYDAQYRESRKRASILAQSRISEQRAESPDYDAWYRHTRSTGGRRAQQIIARRRHDDPDYDRRIRSSCSIWGPRYAHIRHVSELHYQTVEELRHHFSGDYYEDDSRLLVFHYTTSGLEYKRFGQFIKCGIMFRQALQPNFEWNGIRVLSPLQHEQVHKLCQKAQVRLLRRYAESTVERLVVRSLPTVTLGQSRRMEDAHLALLMRVLGQPLGQSLEYFPWCGSDECSRTSGLQDQPLFSKHELRIGWPSPHSKQN